EGDVAELGRGLHAVAEMAADIFLVVGGRQHANAIAKLKHQIRRWDDVHVIAPDVQEMSRETGRQWKPRQRNADEIRFADKHTDVIERGAVFDDPTRLKPSQLSASLSNRILPLTHDHQPVAGSENEIGIGNDVLMILANHSHLDAFR